MHIAQPRPSKAGVTSADASVEASTDGDGEPGDEACGAVSGAGVWRLPQAPTAIPNSNVAAESFIAGDNVGRAPDSSMRQLASMGLPRRADRTPLRVGVPVVGHLAVDLALVAVRVSP